VLLSLRRRGQLLLLTCALLGVVVGSSLGMAAGSAGTLSALMAPARERGASAVAANPPTAQPSRPHATAPRAQASGAATVTRSRPAHRADRRHKAGKAEKTEKTEKKHGKHHREGHAHRGKGKHQKDK
jgi:hypothetical protein